MFKLYFLSTTFIYRFANQNFLYFRYLQLRLNSPKHAKMHINRDRINSLLLNHNIILFFMRTNRRIKYTFLMSNVCYFENKSSLYTYL